MGSKSDKLSQRTFRSFSACESWCSARADCLAVVVSPASWAHRECFLVGTATLGTQSNWSGAKKTCFGESVYHCDSSEPSSSYLERLYYYIRALARAPTSTTPVTKLNVASCD